MIDATTIVLAGGIVPNEATVAPEVRCGAATARTYAHPAVLGRPVIRLVADAVADGADAEMDTLGFARQDVRAALGKVQYRSLGFPGWALVNDPARARFALDVMKDFKRAAARIKSKPGHAKDAFAEIAERLGRSVPHFLPSFWEEAGRCFLVEENKTFASQAFEKARDAERVYKLTIDEEVRSSAYLEFALAGALSAKTLSGYAQDLDKAYGGEQAYRRFRDLAVRRMLGGMPPWSGLPKDLRGLAKTAGRKADVEDEQFVAEVLEAQSLTRAPGDFWKSYRGALVKLAKGSAEVRARLRHLFPQPAGDRTKFAVTWLELLDDAGALEALCATSGPEAAAEAAGAPAAWFGKTIGYTDADDALVPIATRMAGRLVADGVKVQVDHGRWRNALDLDLCEHLLGLGIPVRLEDEDADFDLTEAFECDPVLCAAHPLLSKRLRAAVVNAMGNATFEAAAAGKAGLVAARHDALLELASEGDQGAVHEVETLLEQLEEKTTPAVFNEFPDVREVLERFDVGAALARSLRGGAVEEFEWPAWDEAQSELRGKKSAKTKAEVTLEGAFPYPVLRNDRRAIALGARGRLAEHDFALPAKAEVQHVYYLGGQFLVIYWDRNVSERVAYWSARPKETFNYSGSTYFYGATLPLVVDRPDGSVVFGGYALKPGDTEIRRPEFCVSDGPHFWQSRWDDGRWGLAELDPVSGKTGRFSWPGPLVEASQRTDGMHLDGVELYPVPDLTWSPLGVVDGLVGHWNRSATADDDHRQTLESLDGSVWTRHPGKPMPDDLLRLPGGDARPRGIEGDREWESGEYVTLVRLYDPEGRVVAATRSSVDPADGLPSIPPPLLWHFVRPVSEASSAALRQLTDDTGRGLLAAVRELGEEEEEDAVTDALRATVRAHLPGVDAPRLLEAVCRMAGYAARVAKRHSDFVSDRVSGGGGAIEGLPTIPQRTLSEALRPIGGGGYYWGTGTTYEDVALASAFLVEGTVRSGAGGNFVWEELLDSIGSVAYLAAAPLTGGEHREALVALLRLWSGSVFATQRTRLRVAHFRLPEGSDWARKLENADSDWAYLKVDESRYFARVVDDPEDLDDESMVCRAIEYSEDGTWRLPPKARLLDERRLSAQHDGAWLHRFLAELDARGAVTWSEEAFAAFAEGSGMTRAEAALFAAGMVGLGSWESNFLDKDQRALLNLKAAEAKVARDSLRELSVEGRRAVLSEALGSDPAGLWDVDARVGRLVTAFRSHFGSRVALRDDVVADCQKNLVLGLGVKPLLTALVEPASAPFLKPGSYSFADAMSSHDEDSHFHEEVVTGVARLVPYLFHSLAVGDPYRNALVGLTETVLDRLTDPSLLFSLRSYWIDRSDKKEAKRAQALFDLVGGEETVVVSNGDEKSVMARDNGTVVVAHFPDANWIYCAFRPARVQDLGASSVLWKLSDLDDDDDDNDTLTALSFVRSASLKAMLDRIRTTPVPDGQWEQNPALSVPDLIKAVGKKHKLSSEAATLYLQTLTLLEPTTKAVQSWNGWKPAVYKSAAAELVGAQLLVEGKRTRAGREVFLPGGWDKGSSREVPTETWKQALYKPDGVKLPDGVVPLPVHQLFEAAWKRVESGDVPAFEEV